MNDPNKGPSIARGALLAAQGHYPIALAMVAATLADLTSPSKPRRDSAKHQVKSWVANGQNVSPAK